MSNPSDHNPFKKDADTGPASADTMSGSDVTVATMLVTKVVNGHKFSPIMAGKLPAEIALIKGDDWRVSRQGTMQDPDDPSAESFAVVELQRIDQRSRAVMVAVVPTEFVEITLRRTCAVSAKVERYVINCDTCNRVSFAESVKNDGNPSKCIHCNTLLWIEIADIDTTHI